MKKFLYPLLIVFVLLFSIVGIAFVGVFGFQMADGYQAKNVGKYVNDNSENFDELIETIKDKELTTEEACDLDNFDFQIDRFISEKHCNLIIEDTDIYFKFKLITHDALLIYSEDEIQKETIEAQNGDSEGATLFVNSHWYLYHYD